MLKLFSQRGVVVGKVVADSLLRFYLLVKSHTFDDYKPTKKGCRGRGGEISNISHEINLIQNIM